MQQPMHIVISQYKMLTTALQKEKEAMEAAQRNSKSPSMPRPTLPSGMPRLPVKF